ncbi:CBS domain-containing protein [Streptomyces xiamenensis]|uniref:CBS domain-containing protein n=1 Tax=Streptomyces xiamenensis TaxID=408015 RepID=UPI0037D06E58
MPSEQQLLDLKGSYIAVHELLALFGARVRNDHTVLTITQALTGVGLSTVPNFDSCSSTTDVLIVAHETISDPEPEDEDTETQELSPGALPHQSFQVGDIPAARGGVESVLPTASVNRAAYLMSMKNYSQLPVLEGRSKLHGVITWKSVATMYGTGVDPTLASAMVNDPPQVPSSQDFFATLPMISEYGYVLVRENDGQVTGIVTAADITDRFDATAWPFFVVGEIEYRLRKCLGGKISPDAIRAVQKSGPGKVTGQITDLMFGGYVLLFRGDQKKAPDAQPSKKMAELYAQADQNWQDLGWNVVDRVQFVHQLGRVRDIRNRIAHFDPEPLPPRLCDELRQFVSLLRQLS